MARVRIPETISAFNSYIVETDKRLQATNPGTGNNYWKDYGLNSQHQSDWHDRRVKWEDTIYKNYSYPATSTSIAKAELRKFMKEFRAFANPLLNKIVASGMAGNAEEHLFNFKLNRHKSSHAREAVKENCVAAVKSVGGGRFSISCKTSHEEGRARKPKGADGVLFSYVILEKSLDHRPTPDDKAMRERFSSKAKFTVEFGGENLGKWLVIYFRWYNSKNPQLAGVWSGMQMVVIG